MARTMVCGAKPLPEAEFSSAEDCKKGVPTDCVRGAAAKMLEFELAAALRDQIIELRGK